MRTIALGVAAALTASSALLGPASAAPAAPSAEPEADAFTVDDAQLAWGLNLESSNAAFAPGTVNMFGAGTIDPGGGGRKVTPALWRQRAGDVRIEKADAEGFYRPATWAGLTTQANGERLGGPASGTFSHHRVVLDGGDGTVDPEAGTARIAWDGTFTVLYYSGMSAFTVSDPELVVTAQRAVLRGTLGGWASSMDDVSTWVPMDPTPAVLATLDRRTLELPEAGGLTATPAYAGVRYDAPRDAAPQRRDGPHWGSWPRTWVDFQQEAGSASYWYSSGGQTDQWKAATPLTVSWEAGDPLTAPAPPAPPASGGDPETPEAPDPPAPPPAPAGAGPQAGPPAGGSGPTATPARRTPAAPAPPPAAAPPEPVVRALSPVAAPATVAEPSRRWPWLVGSVLLLVAAALLVPRPLRSPHPLTPPGTTRESTRGPR